MRILSGIQPSGTLHLGNYFGMMKPAIELQEKGEAFYFIAELPLDDLACSTPASAARTRWTWRWISSPAASTRKRTVFFRQSDVPEVHRADLAARHRHADGPAGALPLATRTRSPRASRLNHGLFAYPVLMAADILIYDSNVVPVGQDQKQHVEVTRDIAIKFNEQYGETFVIPEPQIRDETAKVPGLDGEKMSKSYGNTIEIFGEAKTRCGRRSWHQDRLHAGGRRRRHVERSSIVALYRLFASPADVEKMEADFREGGFGYGDFKKRLFEAIWNFFAPMRARRAEILGRPGLRGNGAARGSTRKPARSR